MSSCAGTAKAAQEGPPWSSLPPGVLQLIFDAASRWQDPGPCLAARVCRAWRSAAAGCGGIRLLYVAQAANTSFNAWLGRNSHQLGSLVLSDGNQRTIHDVLGALADAATAAAAAGRPLRLHTLRVLEGDPFMAVTGRLVSVLPNLLCLQLPPIPDSYRTQAFVVQMAPFQQATQLQELYFSGPPQFMDCVQQVVDLLPASLQRLSWAASRGAQCPDLSHLTRLTFLQLRSWPLPRGPLTSKLPPGLQQLELAGDCMSASQLQEQNETLTGCHGVCDEGDQLQLQSHWANLRSWSGVPASRLLSPRVGGVLQQLVKLSSLGVTTGPADDLQPVVSAASSLKRLRRLQLQMRGHSLAPGQLAALTQLSLLHVCGRMYFGRQGQLQVGGDWAAELGRMSRLRWLSAWGSCRCWCWGVLGTGLKVTLSRCCPVCSGWGSATCDSCLHACCCWVSLAC